MPTALLSTKLFTPPARDALVARPQLIARLEAALRPPHKLTLVCAPAGFGKTTLLSAWLAARSATFRLVSPEPLEAEAPQHPTSSAQRSVVAWLSLDGADSDLLRFWSYVVAALDTLQPGCGASALALLQSSQPPSIEAVLTPLLNTLSTLAADAVLVLDDYHLIDSPSIHSTVAELLHHLPPRLHLVITARADPPLPLTRLRARGQLTELRAADLRFTADEAAAFLNDLMGIPLSAGDVAALETRTEGWIAGLQLAALALQHRADSHGFVRDFSGSNRFVVDYLTEEVLASQPFHIQTFLLQTATLERMCGSLCDAVLGLDAMDAAGGGGHTPSATQHERSGAYSQLILEQLERTNLFIAPLDDARQWYRYHHLFADVLRERLRAGASGASIAELHRRASVWFERQGLEVEAIAHALPAGDWERALRLIQAWAWPVVFGGQIQTVLGWFAALPAALLRANPGLIVLHANLLMHTRRLEDAATRLKEAEDALLRDIDEQQARLARVGIPTTWGNICFYRGDLAGCVAHGREALALAADTPLIAHVTAMAFAAHSFLLSGDVRPAVEAQVEAVPPVARAAGHRFVLLRSLTLVAQLHTLQGRLHAAAGRYREAEQLAPEPGGVLNLIGSPGYAFGLGDLRREWNDLDGAERLLRAGMERAQGGLTTNATYFCQGAIALARLQQARGDALGARSTLEHFAEMGRQHAFDPLVLARGRATWARLALAQGDDETALRWAASCGLRADDHELPFPRELEYLTLARVLIAQGRGTQAALLGDALALLGRLLEAAEAGARAGSAIEILVLRALALQARGDTAGALAALKAALALAEPEGYVRIVVDEGQPMAVLLGEARARGIAPAYAARLLAAFPEPELASWGSALGPDQPEAATHDPRLNTHDSLVEPLSARELEILHLIAAGHSNQAIADTLIIAVSTVKRHINNIYGKLDVQSRTQALARARALQLL